MLKISHLTLNDLPHIYRLGEKLFTSEKFTTLHRMWSEEEIVAHFSEDWKYCFVAKDGAKIAGFILSTLITKPRHAWKYGHITWLDVRKSYQRQHVAKRLLIHASKILKEEGARILVMDTSQDNAPAIKFFERNGFSEKTAHVYLYKNIDEA